MAAVPSVVLPVMLLSLLLFLNDPLLTAEKAQERTVRPGCESSCGNVSIPFPIGMKEGCYLERSYRIDCINRSVPIITLNGTTSITYEMLRINGSTSATHLEVLSISVKESTVRVKFPLLAFSSKCEGGSRTHVVDLEGTPFAFSSKSNSFIARGCDNLALMTDKLASTLGGCMSICGRYSDSNDTKSSCSGIECCQTSIPTFLKVLNITLRGVTDNKEVADFYCRYAYLVEQKWIDERVWSNTSAPYAVIEREYVPAVLDWCVKNGSLSNTSTSSYTISCVSGPPINQSYMRACTAYSRCRSLGEEEETIQCSCKYGFEGNPYLGDCQVPVTGAGYVPPTIIYPLHQNVRAKIAGIGIGVGLGTLFLLIGVWRLHKVFKRRRNEKLKKKYFKRNGGLLLQEQLSSGEVNVERIKMFTAKELDKATDHYNVNRMLGQGGQGIVYKGMLADGNIAAIKKSKILDDGKLKQFINEIIILSQINHRNVVKLLGCFLEIEVPMLVYEFIPNGTLFQFLHEPNEEIPFTWEMRLRMATEVAGALSYLHSAASIPIYHRDIKSTNILLDEKYRPKVADFGTSRTSTIDQTHVTTKVQGTFGYLDPEYFRSRQLTDKSDVYIFGVVLVELITRQKAVSVTESDEEARGLVMYFIQSLETNSLFDILDPQVMKQCQKEDAMMVATLAKSCLSLNGKKRPTMKEVMMVLEGIQKSQGNEKSAKHLRIECNRNYAKDVSWDLDSTSTSSSFEIGAAPVSKDTNDIPAAPSSKDTKPFLHTY